MPTVKDDLLSLADVAFRRLRDRVEGLSDEEYLWEPAPGCWTVRPAGDGTWRADASVLPPETVEALLAADPELRGAHPAIVATAAAAGRWAAVRLLVGLGFEANVAGEASPLYLAAGAGELETVRLLVRHGADLAARDPRFDETPLGWARYFGQNDVADYLLTAPEPRSGARSPRSSFAGGTCPSR
jgi:hypothetical protein